MWTYQKLIRGLEKRQFHPVYIIDGEETYYLDLVTKYFEQKILSPAERDFNLTILYGKETHFSEVITVCRQLPAFAECRIVILKDASHTKELKNLAVYLEKPTDSTILLIEHSTKKIDSRWKLTTLAKTKGVYLTFDRIKDDQLPAWISRYGAENNVKIGESEAQMLTTFLGNDLKKIVHEIEKVRLNVPTETTLSKSILRKYIGISRDYNIFELPAVLTSGNKERLYLMLSYFTSNPKSAPFPLVIGSFYNHFQAIYQAQCMKGRSDREISAALKLYGERLQQTRQVTNRFSRRQIEYCLILLGAYSAKAVGIHSQLPDHELLKEMIGKLDWVLQSPA